MAKEKQKLKIIPLGGTNGIGRNMTVFEYGNDMIVVDCGLSFPDGEMFGVDLVIPDMTYIEENSDKLRALILTHGHEDHIGAVPYFLKRLQAPVYGTRLTLGILEDKLIEHDLLDYSDLVEISAGSTVKIGVFTVEFIPVTHSIPDSVALCIETPVGRIIHTGDFKIDHTPVNGEMMDLQRFAILGSKGVRLLMCDSTNVERSGYTPSESTLYNSLERYFALKDKRIVAATFASNIHRVQQIIDISAKYGRRVVLTGRSMVNIVSAAIKLGYMDIPNGILADISELKKLPPNKVTIITTGSQGEPMSALYRMAFGEHNQISVGKGDLVILSSSPIPGNEKFIINIIKIRQLRTKELFGKQLTEKLGCLLGNLGKRKALRQQEVEIDIVLPFRASPKRISLHRRQREERRQAKDLFEVVFGNDWKRILEERHLDAVNQQIHLLFDPTRNQMLKTRRHDLVEILLVVDRRNLEHIEVNRPAMSEMQGNRRSTD